MSDSQQELAAVRERTSALIAAAEDRLRWMDEYYLNPETFERRLYMRLLVRSLRAARKAAGVARRLRSR